MIQRTHILFMKSPAHLFRGWGFCVAYCRYILVFVFLFGLVSCKTTSGEIEMVSLANTNVRISPKFATILFKKRGNEAVTVIMSDLSSEALKGGHFDGGTVLVIDMFLRPKAGSTPIEGTATNASFRQVIFPDSEIVGVYGGGGFVYPTSKVSSGSFSADIFDATLKLVRSTDGFADRMHIVQMTGTIEAGRDDEAVSTIAILLNTEVSKRLGSIYFVVSD